MPSLTTQCLVRVPRQAIGSCQELGYRDEHNKLNGVHLTLSHPDAPASAEPHSIVIAADTYSNNARGGPVERDSPFTALVIASDLEALQPHPGVPNMS